MQMDENKLSAATSQLSTHPYRIYKNKGWKGFQDYLGYSNDVRKKDFVDYDECKSYAIKMKVKTS